MKIELTEREVTVMIDALYLAANEHCPHVDEECGCVAVDDEHLLIVDKLEAARS
jgi:hypothetical protein